MISDSVAYDFVTRNFPEYSVNIRLIAKAFILAMMELGSSIDDDLEIAKDNYNPFAAYPDSTLLYFDDRLRNLDLSNVEHLIGYAINSIGFKFFYFFFSQYYSDFELFYSDELGNLFSAAVQTVLTDVGLFTDEGFFTDEPVGIPTLLLKYYFAIDEVTYYQGILEDVKKLVAVFKPASKFMFMYPVFSIDMNTLANFDPAYWTVVSDNPPSEVKTDLGLLTDSGLKTDLDLDALFGTYVRIIVNGTTYNVNPIVYYNVDDGDGNIVNMVVWELKIDVDIDELELEGASTWFELSVVKETLVESIIPDGKMLLRLVYKF
jgi:hypothetical protein